MTSFTQERIQASIAEAMRSLRQRHPNPNAWDDPTHRDTNPSFPDSGEAVYKVFHISELTGKILNELPIYDLVVATQVCQYFHHFIPESPKLKSRLFRDWLPPYYWQPSPDAGFQILRAFKPNPEAEHSCWFFCQQQRAGFPPKAENGVLLFLQHGNIHIKLSIWDTPGFKPSAKAKPWLSIRDEVVEWYTDDEYKEWMRRYYNWPLQGRFKGKYEEYLPAHADVQVLRPRPPPDRKKDFLEEME